MNPKYVVVFHKICSSSIYLLGWFFFYVLRVLRRNDKTSNWVNIEGYVGTCKQLQKKMLEMFSFFFCSKAVGFFNLTKCTFEHANNNSHSSSRTNCPITYICRKKEKLTNGKKCIDKCDRHIITCDFSVQVYNWNICSSGLLEVAISFFFFFSFGLLIRFCSKRTNGYLHVIINSHRLFLARRRNILISMCIWTGLICVYIFIQCRLFDEPKNGNTSIRKEPFFFRLPTRNALCYMDFIPKIAFIFVQVTNTNKLIILINKIIMSKWAMFEIKPTKTGSTITLILELFHFLCISCG